MPRLVGALVEVNHNGEWLPAKISAFVPAGTKVIFESGNTSAVIDPSNSVSRIRDRPPVLAFFSPTAAQAAAIPITAPATDDDEDDDDQSDDEPEYDGEQARYDVADEDQRALRKRRCFENVKKTAVRIERSEVHGVGVVAVRDIEEDENPFKLNGPMNGVTIDFSNEEIDTLSPAVRQLVHDFIIPNDDGTFAIPEAGMLAMNISFFLNESRGRGLSANIGMGNRHDDQGYTVMQTTSRVQNGHELLLPDLRDPTRFTSGRSTGQPVRTQDGVRVEPNYLQGDGLNQCRICQTELDIPRERPKDSLCPCNGGGGEIVDLGCHCANARVHSHGAFRWFLQRITVGFEQDHPDGADSTKIVNQWRVVFSATCDVCKGKLGQPFTLKLLRHHAAKGNTLCRQVEKHMRSRKPVLLKVAEIPVPITRTSGGGKSGQKSTSSTRTPPARFQNLGTDASISARLAASRLAATQDSSATRTERETRDLQSSQSAHEERELKRQKKATHPESWVGKRVNIWMDEDQRWVRGKVLEFISAEQRTKNTKARSRDAVYTGPKFARGKYKYEFATEIGDEDTDYFSDGDASVVLSSTLRGE